MFGGRCNKYANIRKKKVFNEAEVIDYIEKRNDILFKECAPDPETLAQEKRFCRRHSPLLFHLYALAALFLVLSYPGGGNVCLRGDFA
ncbi:MAG: hypothetical protein M0C28_10580 [Candidatus Moduliflexus flocculans]|nr:hypothetical protein [Candidatus Moduliflexus flocculans]